MVLWHMLMYAVVLWFGAASYMEGYTFIIIINFNGPLIKVYRYLTAYLLVGN